MATETRHIPVLLNEVLEALDVQPADTVLDGTLGGGGHASAIIEKLGDKGTLIGLDQDVDALARSRARLGEPACRLIVRESNFRNLDQVLDSEGITEIDKALFDLGWSSDQMADPERGLSFQSDGPLNMTLKKNPLEADVTAFDIVNHWQEETIADILYAFGDERYSRRIARGIVEAREQEPISTTLELVDIIRNSVPGNYRNGRIHPATRTFQALRIIVNDEYEAIKEALDKTLTVLRTGGRIAVISFHSGEDKIVKEYFKQKANDQVLTLVSKKPIVPTEAEVTHNPRARSAKLRIIQKT